MFGVREVFGLPVHPLVVHAAVVLVPLAVLALIALGWRKEWRQTYALPIAVLAVGGAVAAFIAAQTGESIESTIRDAARAAGQRASFGDHPEQGTTAEIAAFVFALTAVGVWAVQRWQERLQLNAKLPGAAYVVSSVTGVFALGTIIVAGHSGATLVWKDLGNFISPR